MGTDEAGSSVTVVTTVYGIDIWFSTGVRGFLFTKASSSVGTEEFFPRGKNGRGVKVATYLHVFPGLRMGIYDSILSYKGNYWCDIMYGDTNSCFLRKSFVNQIDEIESAYFLAINFYSPQLLSRITVLHYAVTKLTDLNQNFNIYMYIYLYICGACSESNAPHFFHGNYLFRMYKIHAQCNWMFPLHMLFFHIISIYVYGLTPARNKGTHALEIMWKNNMCKGNIQFYCAWISYILNK
jgi:hypothetical protein